MQQAFNNRNLVDMSPRHNGTSETSTQVSLGSTVSMAWIQTVGKIVLKARLACSQPALEAEDFAAATGAWVEVLSYAVPLAEVQACYLHAMAHRTGSFPLAASELCAAWTELKETRQARLAPPKCGICHGTGFGVRYDKATDSDLRESCPYCTTPSSALTVTK